MKKNSTQEEIKRAMADLKAIQDERGKLQELLSKAQKEKDAASAALQAAERDNKAPKANYSDQKYWDSRYTSKTDIGANRTYEWYLSSDIIYEKLKLDAINNRISPTASILVPGCGNSTLCEDLYKEGHRNVAGMDYSIVVVDAMKKRGKDLKLNGLRYFQADARSMTDESSSSYSIIVDKGTLDAIAAGGDTSAKKKSNTEVELEFASQYMIEMWRVLATEGLFVVITTMPPDVFEPIAIAPLVGMDGNSSVVNWKNGHTAHQLNTPEGGAVYYYCLKKLGNVVKSRSKTGSAVVSSNNSLKSSDSAKADMMEGIKALLEEARLAKEQVDKAMQMQSAAVSDFEGVTAKKNDLSSKLNRDLLDAERDEELRGSVSNTSGADASSGSGLANQLMAGMKDAGKDAETMEKIRKVKEEARRSMPAVKVVIDDDSSDVVSQGYLEVSYLLSGADLTCWDEDDSICIVCSRPGIVAGPTTSSDKDDDLAMYKAGESQHYESFEYTVQPVRVAAFDSTTLQAFQPLSNSDSSNIHFCGHVRVPLPSYGGWFHVSYVRTISHTLEHIDPTSGAVTAEYKRIPVKLYQTNSFSVKACVFNAPPEGFTSKTLHRSVTAKSLRRRGAADMSRNQGAFDVCIEDMQHIQTMTVSFIPSTSAADTVESDVSGWLSRVMVWLYAATEKPSVTELSIEADLVIPASNGSLSVKTVYGKCQWSEALVTLVRIDLTNAWSEVDECGRITCRIPYRADEKLPSSSKEVPSETVSIEEGVEIQCGFCMNPLVRKGVVTTVKPMATGLFDNMMHDFICCEEMPNQALTTGDVITPEGTLYVGSTYLSINTKDSLPSSYTVECKAYNSLLDTMTAHGGAFCTAPVFSKTCTKASMSVDEQKSRIYRALKGFISTDSCAVTCSRCCSYLGEGLLNRDECDPALCEHPTGAATARSKSSTDQGDEKLSGSGVNSGNDSLTAEDVSDLKLARHCISIVSPPSIAKGLNVESVVVRTLLHFHSVYSMSTFCLHVNNRPPEELIKIQNSQARYNTVMIVTLLNKNYKSRIDWHNSGSAINRATSSLSDCIKVSYRCGNAHELISGTETRIPLMFDEFWQIQRVLKSRENVFGKSPFKNQSIAVLFDSELQA